MKKRSLTGGLFALSVLLIPALAICQAKVHEKDLFKRNDSGWYASPWVWAAGAVLMCVLLIAVINDVRKRNRG